MKKILAIALSLVMMFSLAVVPVTAADVTVNDAETAVGDIKDDASVVVDSAKDIYDDFKAEDYDAVIEGIFDFAADLAKAIHTLVHNLSDLFDFDCPFCVDEKDVVDEEEDVVDPDEGRAEGPAYVLENTGKAGEEVNFANAEVKADTLLIAKETVGAIWLTNIVADVKNAVILEEENTVVFQGGNYTLAEGGKLVINNSGSTTIQVVFGGEIIVNGEVLTYDNVDQYLDGVATYFFA